MSKSKEDRVYDIVAGMSFGGTLSNRITVDEATERISRVFSEDNWIPVDKERMPLETSILAKCREGVVAIHFFNHEWVYWYSANKVDLAILKSITHWLNPNNL